MDTPSGCQEQKNLIKAKELLPSNIEQEIDKILENVDFSLMPYQHRLVAKYLYKRKIKIFKKEEE